MMAGPYSDLAARMKKAVKRAADGKPVHYKQLYRVLLLILHLNSESDSDDSVDIVTNRGNKFKKRAKYVHEGQLAPPSGPQVYKRVCNPAERC
jgi:hypothetical protein